jgi:osomolarity two-component system sensor histidine kinase SLN1
MDDLLEFSDGNVAGNTQIDFVPETFVIRHLMTRCQTIFQKDAQEKAIVLQVSSTNEKGIAIDASASNCTYADQRRLLQILINLISNALKFSPQSSIVQVRLSHTSGIPTTKDHKSTLILPGEGGRRGAMLKMEVEDQGPGIPTDLQRSIFEPFNRSVFRHNKLATDPGGIGLGLSMAARLVARMEGSIMVKVNWDGKYIYRCRSDSAC